MTSNKTKPEYIEELPEKVYDIVSYDTIPIALFDRYWWDPNKNRIIMKPKSSADSCDALHAEQLA